MNDETVPHEESFLPPRTEWSASPGEPEATCPDPRPAATPEDLPWRRSYDRSSVDRFFAEAQAERARLQAEIEATRARARAAEAAAAARAAEVQAELGVLVLAARHELAQIDEEHRQILSTIAAAAESEAARVLAAAQREAAAIRTSTASLATLLSGGGLAEPTPGGVGLSSTGEPSKEQADAG